MMSLVHTSCMGTEYHRVGRLLAARHEGVDLEPVLALVAARADVVDAPDLPEKVCPDPDDDKFLACAMAGEAPVVVSGDKVYGASRVGAGSRF